MKKGYVFYSLLKAIIVLHFISAILLLPIVSNAQSESEKGLPFITNYSPKIYKAFPQIWSVLEDESGIMYFGTQNDLLEYDGVKWRKIKFRDSTGANLGTVIRSMAKNNKGTIYYGGFGDLGYLDFDSLGQRRSNSLLDLVPFANRNFLDIWSAYATGSGIYFQSREYIFRLDDKKVEAGQKPMVKVWAPKTKFMYSFYLDGNYYVHQQGLGLFKMTNDSLVLVPGSEFLGKERMQVMLPYKTTTNEKQYLIGMFYSGLYIYDGKTFQPFSTEADDVIKTGALLYKGIQLQNGSYVLSTTGKGMVIINAQGKLLQKINRDVGLQDESIYGVYQDKKGTLWLALDNGISRVETASPLTKFGLQAGINTGVLFLRRFESDLYVGTSNGLLKLDQKAGIFNPVPGIPLNQIFTTLPDGKELLVPGDGLFKIKDNKTYTIKESVSADLTLSALYVSKKYPDILIGGGTFGIAIFTRSNGNWVFTGYVPGVSDQIWSFSENKDGTIWAGTQSGFVYLLNLAFDTKSSVDLQKTKFERFGPESGFRSGLGQVYFIKGKNYFIGDSTLYTYDEKNKRFNPDTTFGSFTHGGGATEFEMVEDAQGRVWIRFGKETRLAIPKPEGGYRLDFNQLRPINELNIQKIYPENNGIVWVCTTDGLIRYDENLEKNYDQSFKTVIRHIAAGKKQLTTSIDKNAKQVSVTYKDNTFRFEYASPFFEQEDKTQYQTWLEGFENTWSDLDINYYKEYTNLPTGQYTFHVRALNIYGKLSEEAVYHFEILPPWYRTWWAYLLYAIAAAIIIYSLIRWRTRKLHEKHRELEIVVSDRTKELSHRVEELAVINSVQDGLVREMDMKGIYNLVGEKMRDIFNAQVIDIVTYDKITNQVTDQYTYEKGDRTLLAPRPLKGFRKHVVETAKPLLINKDVNGQRSKHDQTVLVGEGAKSIVLVPMIAGNEVTGIISLQNLDKEDAFSDNDVNLLTTLSNSMSVALESAKRFDETKRLLKETEQRTAELAVINSVQEGLAKELDIQGIYELVGDKIRKVFNAPNLVIRTFDHSTGLENWRYAIEKGERQYIEPKPFAWHSKLQIQSQKPIHINDNYLERAKEHGGGTTFVGQPTKSGIFVPMIVGGVVKGSISLQNVDKEYAYSEADL
ncbi:MAG TPA: GAF domain-containing protein, partial [Chitinophagaceae bacterium]